MAEVTVFVLWTIAISGLISLYIVELRKRKNKLRDDDDKSLATGFSESDDAISDAEVDTRPKPKRKKEDVESPNITNTRKSSADSGPHVCRFCKLEFKLSQALGGHMNRHRSEKERETIEKAESLVAQKQQQYMPWNMQGGGGGGNPYYGGTLLSSPPGPMLGTSSRQFYATNQSASTPQNSQLNQVLVAQQNAQVAIQSLQGGGYYNPMDNTTHYGMPSQRNAIPTGQFQGLHTQGVNFGVNLGQRPVQTAVYSNSKGSVLHSGTDTVQPHGQSLFHSNQGGLSDTLQDILNTPSNRNQQAQSNVTMASDSFMRQSAHERQINNMQFVDQHGNAVVLPDFQPSGHSSQMPQGYTQTSLDQTLGTSVGSLRNESASIRSEHGRASGHGVFRMPILDAGQDFQGGTDQSTTLIESGQAGFETDTSVDDHTSGGLP